MTGSRSKDPKPNSEPDPAPKKARGLTIEGYPIEGLSIGGHETCIIFPTLNLSFDIGRCPQRAISQEFLFISHAHMDHIGGLPMYVATRGLYSMKPPTIIVPKCIKELVEQLFEVHRKMDQSELKHNLIGLDVGEEFSMRRDLNVKAFRTYHGIPSQGYVVYSVKQKLKQEYIGLSGNEIKTLKSSGVEITNTFTEPQVAFTGDTMSDFITDSSNIDVLKAKILVVESTFLDDSVKVEHARDYGHIHLSEIISHAEKFENRAILLVHFSARYTVQAEFTHLQKVFDGKASQLLWWSFHDINFGNLNLCAEDRSICHNPQEIFDVGDLQPRGYDMLTQGREMSTRTHRRPYSVFVAYRVFVWYKSHVSQ